MDAILLPGKLRKHIGIFRDEVKLFPHSPHPGSPAAHSLRKVLLGQCIVRCGASKGSLLPHSQDIVIIFVIHPHSSIEA
jgi:hypothetical protein